VSERHEAIVKIEETMRNIGLLDRFGYAGEAQLVDWAKSTAKHDPILKFALPDDEGVAPFEGATIRKGKVAGQLYYVFAIPIDDGMRRLAHPSTAPDSQAPCGERHEAGVESLAHKLHRTGYFYRRQLWVALHKRGIYTLQAHKRWIESQPCAKADLGPCDGDVVAHHCNSASEPDAGKRLQPDAPHKPLHFVTVPLCNTHHAWAHSSVGATREDRERMYRYAVDLTAAQVKAALKHWLRLDSLSDLTEEIFETWEKELGL
jgi:hypothetical protein